MFTNILARTLSRLPASHQQQVRYVKKTFRYRIGYGIEPIMSHDDYQKVVEENKVEDLKFERVRFAHITDSCSVLYDKDLNNFTKFVMQGGRRDIAEELMHGTFYLIKSMQYVRKRKLEAKKEAREKDDGKESDIAKLNALNNEIDSDQIELNPMVIFKKALKNVQPVVVTRKVKRGGATYQVPFPLSASQSEYLAVKWLIKAVLDRPKPRVKHFNEVMAQELIDAAENRGKVIKKKDDMHKLADANKAYAHYRWG